MSSIVLRERTDGIFQQGCRGVPRAVGKAVIREKCNSVNAVVVLDDELFR